MNLRIVESETGFEIKIRKNQVQLHCTSSTDTSAKDSPSTLLRNQTEIFMGKFTFHSISRQNPQVQLAILHATFSDYCVLS